MSMSCGELRNGVMKTSFEKVKAFINREDVELRKGIISSSSLDNIKIDASEIKNNFNTAMPCFAKASWEVQQVFDDDNFLLMGRFVDETETTVDITGELKGFYDTASPSDEICKELLKAFV